MIQYSVVLGYLALKTSVLSSPWAIRLPKHTVKSRYLYSQLLDCVPGDAGQEN
jgi:hypothetical protein